MIQYCPTPFSGEIPPIPPQSNFVTKRRVRLFVLVSELALISKKNREEEIKESKEIVVLDLSCCFDRYIFVAAATTMFDESITGYETDQTKRPRRSEFIKDRF